MATAQFVGIAELNCYLFDLMAFVYTFERLLETTATFLRSDWQLREPSVFLCCSRLVCEAYLFQP